MALSGWVGTLSFEYNPSPGLCGKYTPWQSTTAGSKAATLLYSQAFRDDGQASNSYDPHKVPWKILENFSPPAPTSGCLSCRTGSG